MAARIRAEARAKANGDAAPQEALGGEAGPLRAGKRKAPVDPEQEQRREDEDAKKLEAMLPGLEHKLTLAEDEADKVAILAAPLAMEASEELRNVQTTAIRDTERAVKAAQVSSGQAKRELDKRLKEVEAFAPLARESALEELKKLQARLEAAQAKVDEHKNARRDHEQALAAEKLFGELANRLASVEIDCEKAAMMAEPLAKTLSIDPETISPAEIRETKEALRVANAMLAPTMRLISGKVPGLKGAIRARMVELQNRAEASQAILDKAQQTVDEAQSRAAAGPILKQAAERIEKVEEVLQEMRETEAPFLMGIETMPADECGDVLSKMDKAAATAQSALADAHKFISLKLVEVGRLAEGAATSTRKELEKAKQQLDDGFERLKQFQEDAARRKRVNLVVVVKEKIEEAEGAVSRMKEAGSELSLLDPNSLPQALERAMAMELEAQNAVTAARRELQEKQQDIRPHDGANADNTKSNSELLRTKVRVNYMEAELAKFRKLAKSFEEKIKVGKSLGDVSNLLKEAEAEVEELAESAAHWPREQRPPEEATNVIPTVQAKLSGTTVQVEQKLRTAQGLELKELRGIFSRLQRAQSKLDGVKEAARQRSRAASSQVVKQVAEAVRKAEAAVATVSSAAASQELPADRLEELHQQAGEGLALIGSAQRQLVASGAVPGGAPLPLESKVEFARLQLRVKALERKGRMAADRVSSKFEAVANEAVGLALDALRMAARTAEDAYDADTLFNQLSEGGSEVTLEQFCDFLARADSPLPTDRAKLAFKRLAPHGLTRRAFAAALADFQKVVREITLTDEFEIQAAKKVRKLEVGELVQATGAVRENSGLGLDRVQCRAIRDGATGWVTMRSKGGTVYLQRTAKPFLWCAQATNMRATKEAEGQVLQELRPGEVIELLEGPHEERLGSDRRVRGVACHEEAVGWLQVSDKSGNVLAELNANIYKCNEAIAMTDVADFASCTMVRRIDAGEALELLVNEPEVQPAEGGARRKFRACRDNREGWITTSGSQGTVYVRHAPRHYVCLQATPMHTGLGAETAVVRVLMPGEAFTAFEEPRDVSGGESFTVYKARKDGAEGWVTSTLEKEVQPWSSRYKVLRPVPLTAVMAANEAIEPVEVARLLEPGEIVDVAEQPAEDMSTGHLRVRCVALKDKVAGWATVREGPSVLLMRPATAEEEAEAAGTTVDLGEGAPTTPPMAAPRTPPAARGMKRPLDVKEEVKQELDDMGRVAFKGKGKGKKGKGKFGKW